MCVVCVCVCVCVCGLCVCVCVCVVCVCVCVCGQLAARYRKQISLDLMRTMPSNVKFSTQGSKGVGGASDRWLAGYV